MSTIEQIYDHVVEGELNETVSKVQQALDEGLPPSKILQEGLIAAMQEVGELFENGEFFVPEMLIAARAMKAGLNLLKPLLVDQGVEPIGKVVIGTVKGDLHDIGKSLVSMMLEGAGFEIVDLGVDVAPEKFIEELKSGAHILALSALLTTTMPALKSTIEAVEQAGLRSDIIVMVGGAPVTEDYANQIGADGYAPDAASAVRRARELISK